MQLADAFAAEIKEKIADCLDHPLFTKDAAEHAKVLADCLRDIERDCDVTIALAHLKPPVRRN